MNVAIIDNTVLVTFFDTNSVDLLNLIRSIYTYVLIPEEVLAEFLKGDSKHGLSRQQFADRLKIDTGFFRLCNTFDPIVRGSVKTVKGIHKGEAEIISQASIRDVRLIHTDDKPCKNYISEKYPHLYCYNTLFLIARLDVAKLLDSPENAWRAILPRINFRTVDVKNAYNEVYKFLGVAPQKGYVRRLCAKIFEKGKIEH